MPNLPPNSEIELKLRFDPEHVDRLRACHVLSREGVPAPVVKQLESVYFDTPDFRLRDRRVTLRVRRSGDGFVQTVKTAGDGLRRGEWETPVEGMAPNLAAIVDEAALAELGPLAAEELTPVFATHIDRVLYRLETPAVEVAVDQGEIRDGGGAVEPVSEVELELKDGGARDLYALAEGLMDAVPLHLEARTKAERGYALAAGAGPTPTKAGRLHLRADQTVEAAMAAIIRHCLNHLADNHAAAVLGTDPEGVHQMRVAARRLRSLLSMFKRLIPPAQHAALSDDIRWLAGSLGTARDWDVFAADLLAPVEAAFAGDGGLGQDLTALRQVVAEERQRAYQTVRETILSRRYTLLHLRFGRWLEGREWRQQEVSETSTLLFQPVTALAVDMLKRRAKKARKLGAKLETRTDEERHELRIALKKLRYAGEFFRSLFEEETAKRYLARLSSLQDVLGHLNDVSTAARLVNSVALDGAAARGAGLVCGWYARGAKTILPSLYREWHEFRAETPFWHAPAQKA